jgi:putative transposase
VLRQHGCQIAPSGYWAAKARRPSARQVRDGQLLELWDIHAGNYGVCGARTVWHELRRRGNRVARCTVERLTGEHGLTGVVRGKKIRTTMPDPGRPHRGIDLDVPVPSADPTPAGIYNIRHIKRVDMLGGLIHEYRHAA